MRIDRFGEVQVLATLDFITLLLMVLSALQTRCRSPSKGTTTSRASSKGFQPSQASPTQL
jgi:hypothetical protein